MQPPPPPRISLFLQPTTLHLPTTLTYCGAEKSTASAQDTVTAAGRVESSGRQRRRQPCSQRASKRAHGPHGTHVQFTDGIERACASRIGSTQMKRTHASHACSRGQGACRKEKLNKNTSEVRNKVRRARSRKDQCKFRN